MKNQTKRAILFARVTTQEQNQGYSTDAQINTLRKYCAEKQFSIVKEFSISGKADKRQITLEMLKFIRTQHGKFIVVISSISRLQRSFKDAAAIDNLLVQGKIEIHAIRENIILHKDSTPQEIIFWGMNVLMAKTYALYLADQVKRSMKHIIKGN